jgi:lipoprotein-anchoring transpeptidase ErfK/SrfK
MMLDYPNAEDRREFDAAKRAGRISRNARIGHLIEIHGNGGRDEDWTQGCVALSDRDIDDLYARVSVGTPVTIVGGDGNGGAYSRYAREYASGTRGAR